MSHPDVAAQPEDRAVAVERDLEIAFGLARMGDRHEMLAPVLDPFHRTAELARRERDQKILRIELAARAEAAADVVLDVVDRLFRQPHHRRHGAAVEERQLGRARHGQPPAAASHSASRPRVSMVMAVIRCTRNCSRRV